MKVFVTKYALTDGILEKEVEININISDRMVTEVKGNYRNSFHKPFWHLTKDEAIIHAEQLRTRKIISLKKKIIQLEKLTF